MSKVKRGPGNGQGPMGRMGGGEKLKTLREQ